MPKKTKDTIKPKEEKTSFYQAVGRRKESTARVRLLLSEELMLNSKTYKKGDLLVNNRSADHYFPGKIAREMGLGRTQRSPLRYHILRLADKGFLEIKKEATEFQKELLVVKSR